MLFQKKRNGIDRLDKIGVGGIPGVRILNNGFYRNIPIFGNRIEPTRDGIEATHSSDQKTKFLIIGAVREKNSAIIGIRRTRKIFVDYRIFESLKHRFPSH